MEYLSFESIFEDEFEKVLKNSNKAQAKALSLHKDEILDEIVGLDDRQRKKLKITSNEGNGAILEKKRDALRQTVSRDDNELEAVKAKVLNKVRVLEEKKLQRNRSKPKKPNRREEKKELDERLEELEKFSNVSAVAAASQMVEETMKNMQELVQGDKSLKAQTKKASNFEEFFRENM